MFKFGVLRQFRYFAKKQRLKTPVFHHAGERNQFKRRKAKFRLQKKRVETPRHYNFDTSSLNEPTRDKKKIFRTEKDIFHQGVPEFQFLTPKQVGHFLKLFCTKIQKHDLTHAEYDEGVTQIPDLKKIRHETCKFLTKKNLAKSDHNDLARFLESSANLGFLHELDLEIGERFAEVCKNYQISQLIRISYSVQNYSLKHKLVEKLLDSTFVNMTFRLHSASPHELREIAKLQTFKFDSLLAKKLALSSCICLPLFSPTECADLLLSLSTQNSVSEVLLHKAADFFVQKKTILSDGIILKMLRIFGFHHSLVFPKLAPIFSRFSEISTKNLSSEDFVIFIISVSELDLNLKDFKNCENFKNRENLEIPQNLLCRFLRAAVRLQFFSTEKFNFWVSKYSKLETTPSEDIDFFEALSLKTQQTGRLTNSKLLIDARLRLSKNLSLDSLLRVKKASSCLPESLRWPEEAIFKEAKFFLQFLKENKQIANSDLVDLTESFLIDRSFLPFEDRFLEVISRLIRVKLENFEISSSFVKFFLQQFEKPEIFFSNEKSDLLFRDFEKLGFKSVNFVNQNFLFKKNQILIFWRKSQIVNQELTKRAHSLIHSLHEYEINQVNYLQFRDMNFEERRQLIKN